jgi:hypothetical protein
MNVHSARRGAVLAAFVTFGALFAAPSATAGGLPGGGGHRAPALCKRVPQLDARIDKALTRLDGDASVNGSIARVRQRIAKAERNGRPEVGAYLQDVLARRQGLVPQLRQGKTDLARVAAWCEARPPSTTK